MITPNEYEKELEKINCSLTGGDSIYSLVKANNDLLKLNARITLNTYRILHQEYYDYKTLP